MAEPTPDEIGAPSMAAEDLDDGARADSAAAAGMGADAPSASSAANSHLLSRKLADAELLLNYAVDAGVSVDAAVVRSILEARGASRTGWAQPSSTCLLLASASLAAALKPVTAESLRNSADYRSKSRGRRLLLPITMGILAAVIVFYSTLAFLFSSFSANIRSNLDVANPLAVRLVSELGSAQSPDPKLCLNSVSPVTSGQAVTSTDELRLPDGINRKDVIEDLQTFASAIRDMYSGARRMNRLYRLQPDPFGFDKATAPGAITEVLELPAGLPNVRQAATERVCVYQRARYYAQSTEESATILTGAVATCILPVLYALLGAGAYVLRRLESQLRSHTFISEAYSPRFITAAIAGAVVGLFNVGQGVSVSPLAIAFLAGYAVDVFFTFLESLIQTLSKTRVDAPSDGSTPGVKA
ncbi:MAG: hypothetical protein ABSH33_07975 [Steroidobacteraceae bacterium]